MVKLLPPAQPYLGSPLDVGLIELQPVFLLSNASFPAALSVMAKGRRRYRKRDVYGVQLKADGLAWARPGFRQSLYGYEVS
jgi:hypothetical protein